MAAATNPSPIQNRRGGRGLWPSRTPPTVPGGAGRVSGERRVLQDPVDQAPLLRLLRVHDVVPLEVALHLLTRPAAVLHVQVDQQVPLAQQLPGLDLDVAGLALDARR